MDGKLFVVSAPSGAGKTSLVDAVLGKLKPEHPIDRLVTYTSRKIRSGEKEGIDFFYVSPDEFEKRIQSGFFIEWSKEYHHYYGSPSHVLDDLKLGNSRVLVIDRRGAKQVAASVEDVVTIWISVPDIRVLKERLVKRGLNTPAQIEKRIEIAKFELEQEEKNDLYTHHIVNDVFDIAAKNLEQIFLKELSKKVNR